MWLPGGSACVKLEHVDNDNDHDNEETLMASMELDVCYATHEGETLDAALAELVRDTDVTATVVQEHGPAGGWPIVRFNGHVEQLTVVAHRYDGDESVADYIVSTVD